MKKLPWSLHVSFVSVTSRRRAIEFRVRLRWLAPISISLSSICSYDFHSPDLRSINYSFASPMAINQTPIRSFNGRRPSTHHRSVHLSIPDPSNINQSIHPSIHPIYSYPRPPFHIGGAVRFYICIKRHLFQDSHRVVLLINIRETS